MIEIFIFCRPSWSSFPEVDRVDPESWERFGGEHGFTLQKQRRGVIKWKGISCMDTRWESEGVVWVAGGSKIWIPILPERFPIWLPHIFQMAWNWTTNEMMINNVNCPVMWTTNELCGDHFQKPWNKDPYSSNHGNPTPSFLGVITNILGV